MRCQPTKERKRKWEKKNTRIHCNIEILSSLKLSDWQIDNSIQFNFSTQVGRNVDKTIDVVKVVGSRL